MAFPEPVLACEGFVVDRVTAAENIKLDVE